MASARESNLRIGTELLIRAKYDANSLFNQNALPLHAATSSYSFWFIVRREDEITGKKQAHSLGFTPDSEEGTRASQQGL